jgi:hypothetical protein
MLHLYPETRSEQNPFDSSSPQSFEQDREEQLQWICLSAMHVIPQAARILTVPLLCKNPPAFLSFSRKKKDVRLMGLNDLASSYESRPGLGINITLTALHASGT